MKAENESKGHLLLELECVEDAIQSLEKAKDSLYEIDEPSIGYIDKIIERLKRLYFYEDL